MSTEISKSSAHVRTSQRGKGHKLTKEETQQAQEKFLQALSVSSSLRAACRFAGVDRRTIYNWEEHDATFSFRYKEAKDEANDRIREELERRAIVGYERPRVSCGKLVYDEKGNLVTEKVYSDVLLSLLAKARLPEFREKTVSDTTIENVNILTIDTRSLTFDQLNTLETMAIDMKKRDQQ